jgi:TolB-like protein
MSGLRSLIQEIHRRSLWQVLGIYIVGSWIALQVVDLLVDSFGLPEWLPPFALALLVIGLPVVVATAFVQEGVRPGTPPTPTHGRVPTDPGAADAQEFPRDPGAQRVAAGQGLAHTADPPTLQRLLTWRHAMGGGVLAFALWGLVATAVLLSGSRPGAAPVETGGEAEDRLRSVAVLPFDNLSPDPDNAYFADGIHEDVLTQLSKIADLTVISRTSVLAYRDTGKPIAEIGSELGVGAIVEGSVRRAGDEVRITAQLIDARTDEHLWADNFDRRLSAASLFSLQSEIAQKIADALQATLTPSAERQIARTPTEDLAAYDFYLQGRNVYSDLTKEGNEEAIRLFGEALSRDGEYADAWAGLADAYGQRAQRFGFGIEWADSSESMARKSLELDPELAAGHKALALAYSQQGRIQLSLESNLRAIELDPNHSSALNNAGVDYRDIGRHDESLRYFLRAARIDPTVGPASTNVSSTLNALGDFDRAEERALEVLQLQPDNGGAAFALRQVRWGRGDYAGSLQQSLTRLEEDPESANRHIAVATDAFFLGDWETVIRHARAALSSSPGDELWGYHHVHLFLGSALLQTGEVDEGRRLLEGLRDDLTKRVEEGSDLNTYSFDVAGVHAALGSTDAALDWAERAYDQGFRYVLGLDVDPVFDSVRETVRWQTLMSRIADDLAEQRANVERWEAEGSL